MSIMVAVLTIALFLAIADWRQPLRSSDHLYFHAPLWFSRLELCITLSTTDTTCPDSYSQNKTDYDTVYHFCPLRFPSEIEAISQNHFGNQVVGCARDTDAETEIDLPLRRNIQVNRRKNLVLLLRDGIESCHRTD